MHRITRVRAIMLAISVVGVALLGCSSTPETDREGVHVPGVKEGTSPDLYFPPVCTTLPNTYCSLDLGYQVKVSSAINCPDIPLPSGGFWTPGLPGAGIWATRKATHPLGTADTTTSGLYDSPDPFAASAWVCSYAYENARNPDGTQYQSTPGVNRIDTSVLCGTLQWSQIAYIVPTWSCSIGNGTSTGGRGCDTCYL